MPDLRTEAAAHDDLLHRRLDNLVPMLMRRAGIDCWIVTGREYAEDPVLKTMLPASWMSGRRRTTLVWFDDGTRHERMAVARYAVADLFPAAWDPESQPDQWGRLAEVVAERDPKAIAINSSRTFALADGITASENAALVAALGGLADRIVGGEALAIGWLETRLPEERATFAEACAVAHGILRRGLSSEAITPGRTTTEGLVWWYRQTVHDAGLASWFQPSVSVQRNSGEARTSFVSRPAEQTIHPGDLVHVDFGIVWKGLCTDQQEHLYVLPPGESDPPDGLVAGMRAGNRMQDLLMAAFATGRTGNQILATSLDAGKANGIEALVYTHALGLHGHAAGPTIGLWDQQGGVPGPGDYPLYPNTGHSIELSVEVPVPEWDGQSVRIMLEQDAWFDGDTCEFLDGRQEELWVM
ncbi:MAG: aminopeptidase P family protein [Acidimicrobiia bacterium]|nr:aminopeptidase P family protein [Acidimicrobiia bacterium]